MRLLHVRTPGGKELVLNPEFVQSCVETEHRKVEVTMRDGVRHSVAIDIYKLELLLAGGSFSVSNAEDTP